MLACGSYAAAPLQLTSLGEESEVVGWSPDGRLVLFRCAASQPMSCRVGLWAVAARPHGAGGAPGRPFALNLGVAHHLLLVAPPPPAAAAVAAAAAEAAGGAGGGTGGGAAAADAEPAAAAVAAAAAAAPTLV